MFIRGVNFIFFGILKGFKRRMIAIGKSKTIPVSIYLPVPFSMSENEPFFQHKQPKFLKVLIFFSSIKFVWGGIPKNAEFYADSKFVKTGSKMSREKVIGKKLCKFLGFGIFCTFFLFLLPIISFRNFFEPNFGFGISL